MLPISQDANLQAPDGTLQLHPWIRMMNQLYSSPPAPQPIMQKFTVTQISPSTATTTQPPMLQIPATTTQPPMLQISDTTTQSPNLESFQNLQLLPSSSQTLQRRKRNWFSDAFSDLTGLARKESVDIIEANENKIREAEERTQKELVVVLTKTNEIVKNMDEQASKLSKLYEDEQDVKLALKNVLRDEQDALLQLSQLSAAIEINSDVATEFMAFSSTLNLVPHMLNEIAESLL